MTKRHFIAIAATFHQQLRETRSTEEDLVIEALAHRQASLFAELNPAFDRSRFLAACGVDAEDTLAHAARLARLPLGERISTH